MNYDLIDVLKLRGQIDVYAQRAKEQSPTSAADTAMVNGLYTELGRKVHSGFNNLIVDGKYSENDIMTFIKTCQLANIALKELPEKNIAKVKMSTKEVGNIIESVIVEYSQKMFEDRTIGEGKKGSELFANYMKAQWNYKKSLEFLSNPVGAIQTWKEEFTKGKENKKSMDLGR